MCRPPLGFSSLSPGLSDIGNVVIELRSVECLLMGHFETKSVDWSGSIVGTVLLHELTFCALCLGGVGSQLPLGTDGGRTGAAPAAVLPRSFFRYPSACRSASLVARKLAPADSLTSRVITASRFVILRRSPSIVTNTGSPSAATSRRRQVFLGPTARAAGLALLEAGVHRRLAVVGGVFALGLGHVSSSASLGSDAANADCRKASAAVVAVFRWGISPSSA
jgi:hypothetical protein